MQTAAAMYATRSCAGSSHQGLAVTLICPYASQYGLQLIDLGHQAYHSFRVTCKEGKMETQRTYHLIFCIAPMDARWDMSI